MAKSMKMSMVKKKKVSMMSMKAKEYSQTPSPINLMLEDLSISIATL